MPIQIDKQNLVFNLQTPSSSYIFRVLGGRFLEHLHYGARVNNLDGLADLAGARGTLACRNGAAIAGNLDLSKFAPGERVTTTDDDKILNPITGELEAGIVNERILNEYPTFANGDLRPPAFHASYPDGNRTSDLRYSGYRVYSGKQPLPGLPATYVESDSEADTLEVDLFDSLTGVTVTLVYTAYNALDAITRHTVIKNGGREVVTLDTVHSANVPFGDHNFDFYHLDGLWGRERHIHSQPLNPGFTGVDSRRGASSHMHNPFVALARKKAEEESGDVYGFSLVYSGNFSAGVTVDQAGNASVQMGINPFDFSWKLEAGDSFCTPEVVMVYSDGGFGKMSRTYHKLYRTRLCRGKYRDGGRPVLINNWEATYFDFTEEQILQIAEKARDCGVELMVLDDGWFGTRNDDKSGLGDWFVNREKLPDGIDGLARKVVDKGMRFGLWFEPEMVQPDSELFRAHPDWCIHVKDRPLSMCRSQLILDLSRQEVCDYIFDSLYNILSTAPISYVKWDMNRYFSEIGSATLPADRQQEQAHRYMLGLYSVLERFVTTFPDVLLEGCASGGGRFDPGMLYYSPQIWTSDDSDAIERLYIQHGTSMCYPLCTMGAHVSVVPNHQVYRTTPLATRGDVATLGQFGYELDLNKLTDDEIEEVKVQITRRKALADIIHSGDLYRLSSPFDSNHMVWQINSEDGNTVIYFNCTILGRPAPYVNYTPLRGLDPDAIYAIRDDEKGRRYSGDALMKVGLYFTDKVDFTSRLLVLDKVN